MANTSLTSKLEAIGDAIREKADITGKLTLDEMADEIRSIEKMRPIVLTGNCNSMFSNGHWDWFLKEYGTLLSTDGITSANTMFNYSNADSIPFDLNFDGSVYVPCDKMFYACGIKDLSNITIRNLVLGDCKNMFTLGKMKYMPRFENFSTQDYIEFFNGSSSYGGFFENCYSLRKIPENFLKELYSESSSKYTILEHGFNKCMTLDEIRGLSPRTGTLTSNSFYFTFAQCYRLKEIIFDVQEDGSPYVVNWSNQTIDLSGGVGHSSSTTEMWIDGNNSSCLAVNADITSANRVNSNATYKALKDTEDWYTTYVNYSRYNKLSAINTINSLPDTSAYLAANGGTNTIKFYDIAGDRTDGGAINTMTDAEIAVATAKGWTVSFV